MIVGLPQRGNMMQRIFDVLQHKGPVSMAELETLVPFDRGTIEEVFRRLRRLRCLASECRDRVWFYGIRKGAARPMGRKTA